MHIWHKINKKCCLLTQGTVSYSNISLYVYLCSAAAATYKSSPPASSANILSYLTVATISTSPPAPSAAPSTWKLSRTCANLDSRAALTEAKGVECLGSDWAARLYAWIVEEMEACNVDMEDTSARGRVMMKERSWWNLRGGRLSGLWGRAACK